MKNKKPRWFIQQNLNDEQLVQKMVAICKKHQLPYALFDLIPFQKDLSLPWGGLLFYGTVQIKERLQENCFGGCLFFDDGIFQMTNYLEKWGAKMLNYGAKLTSVQHFEKTNLNADELVFVRPNADDKSFNGQVKTFGELADWFKSIPNLSPKTQILIGKPYHLQKEWRIWMLNGKAITATQYRENMKLHPNAEVPEAVLKFAQKCAKIYQPNRAFVMDVGLCAGELFIIECGCVHFAGFYKADLEKWMLAFSRFANRYAEAPDYRRFHSYQTIQKSAASLFATALKFEQEHDDEEVRRLLIPNEAYITLQSRGLASDFNYLVSKINGENKEERILAVKIMGQFDYMNLNCEAASIDLLIACLYDTDEAIVAAAAGAIGRRGDERIVPHLINLKNHSNADIRFGVTYSLGVFYHHKEAEDALIDLAMDEDEDVQDWATFGLMDTKIDNERLRNTLLALVNHSNVEIRYQVINGLAHKKDVRVLPYLIDALQEDEPTDLCFARDQLYEAALVLACSALIEPLKQHRKIIKAQFKDVGSDLKTIRRILQKCKRVN